MDIETACHDLKEPSVIDEKILHNAIIQQGPQDEVEKQLFKEQEIVYEEVEQLSLEFLGILKIDHLWMMTGLTKLYLSNNSIEKIENLDDLVNLKDLNLSFNYIEKIENLNALLKLEVLALFQNKIEVLENLSHLEHLTILSVGNNRIANYDSITYLREFDNLKAFSVAGNPICKEENFDTFVLAYLPQLVYYEYRMIGSTEKNMARKFFLYNLKLACQKLNNIIMLNFNCYKLFVQNVCTLLCVKNLTDLDNIDTLTGLNNIDENKMRHELMKLERDEAEIKAVRKAKIEEEKRENVNTEAFVEYLGGNQLFDSLFEKDSDCQTLLKMGDNVMALYNQFKNNFTGVTKELHLFGLEQLKLRKAEIAQFEKYIGDAKEKVFKQSREIVEDFLEQRRSFFSQIEEIKKIEVDDDEAANEVSFSIQIIDEAFKDLCNRTWTVLMKKEVYLFEATEEVNGTYERALTELVNQFIEGCQGLFTQLRQFQNVFNEALTEAANKFYTSYTVSTLSKNVASTLPKDLENMMQDKDYLMNALSASHDYHLLVIDQREDKLISRIKTWLSNFVENLISSEINRNRASVTEINHFLDTQKSDLNEMFKVSELVSLEKLTSTYIRFIIAFLQSIPTGKSK